MKKNRLSIKIESMSDEESEAAYKALSDFWKYGKTNIFCPRCRGKFIYSKQANSSWVECDNKCGVGEVSRGI